jgi:ankyrin repeat protein
MTRTLLISWLVGCFALQGANPNCVNKDGLPALFVAVTCGHADAVPILVQAGAEVNARGPSIGNTPLHEAVGLGPAGCDVIDALLGSVVHKMVHRIVIGCHGNLCWARVFETEEHFGSRYNDRALYPRVVVN